MNVTSVVNYSALKHIEHDMQLALKKTADAVKTNLIESQTMPMETGAMQNRSTFVDDSNVQTGTVRIVSDTPYARRLYFHPEYNFNKIKNPYANAQWFEPYINGDKKDKVIMIFTRFAKI
ncbi:MAG: hypothetical protein NC213_10260 [Acetobacter sp.]|nr:hypothetical protein [Bacteroides sp.]MCM1342117.1 hypothetical protein [Acetobacter sp.]MCM1434336.1 hypothetical protein [Clostridiales bacterium]